VSVALNIPQAQFIASKKPFRGFCGGYRSGKTFIGCVRLWMNALGYPAIKQAYFAPTYPHIRDIFYDTIAEVAEHLSGEWGVNLTVDINQSKHLVTLFCNGATYSTVKCKSMSKPYSIIGFDISHALVDEIDCMKKKDADAAWKKIIARMSSVRSDYPINTVDFTTTPEGFNWMYDFFVRQLREDPAKALYYELIKASTLQNAKNLPDDYIDKLYSTYPDHLVDAYVNGEFVNLESGQVYRSYSKQNESTEIMLDSDRDLIIGMDFNVQKMAACVFVRRFVNGVEQWHCVNEFRDLYDTQDMIDALNASYPTKKITVYPDASGKNRKSNGADVTDIKLLRDAGFKVKAKEANPRVKSRVNAVNVMFCNSVGERRLFVNPSTCPKTHEDLQQQVYNDRGEPDKASGNDHGNDAFGYPVAYEFPITKPKQMGFTRVM